MVRFAAFAMLFLVNSVVLAADGPTPYPDPKNESAWPGKGPIRVHNWMKDNRAYFWTQREKAKESVVFAGDSLTGSFKAELMKASFPNLKIANRGVGGDTSRGLLFRFQEDVVDIKPKALVILIGTNDLSAHGAPADVIGNISQMIDMARKQNPALPVVLCTLPPRDSADAPTKPGAFDDLNKCIKAFAAGKEHLELLDLHPLFINADGSLHAEFFAKDRLHLASAGYQAWGTALAPVFKKLGVE